MKLNKKDMETLRAAFATVRNSYRQKAIDSHCDDYVDAIYEIIAEINQIEKKIEESSQ